MAHEGLGREVDRRGWVESVLSPGWLFCQGGPLILTRNGHHRTKARSFKLCQPAAQSAAFEVRSPQYRLAGLS